jgi:hypothetical protein
VKTCKNDRRRKMNKEEQIYKELKKLYEGIPQNKLQLVDGLIVEAARLKVSLDELWEDIKANGNVELDDRGKEKERPTSAIFTSRDKSYRATIKSLEALLPASARSSGFSKLDDDDEEDDDG